jgi:hypothetical protein
MIPSLFGDSRRARLIAAFAVLGIVMTVRADRASVARANRLHRADAIDQAASIYAERLADEPQATRLRYNYGTTLLRLGEPGAFEELAAGSSTDDDRQRVSAYYNMGLWSLIRALVIPTTDSVLYHAANAVEANKAALRLDPDHLNARWNLALAQRLLVQSAPEQGLMDPGNITGPDNIGERMETPDPLELANREGLEDVSVVGESEAPAGDDLQPLSPVEASEILGTSHLDPSRIIAKMLDREGRARRRQRIFVEGNPW